MPALVTNKFRMFNARQFRESFDEDFGMTTFANTVAGDTYLESNMYLFIGGVQNWANVAGAAAADSDTTPPTPTDDVSNTYYNHWKDMIAAKKVSSTDVTHCIPRYNWANNTPYFAFDNTETAMLGQSFFVLTDDYNVYKCLANNNSAGNSVAKPTGQGTSIVTPGSDGYKWKYMYTISAASALKFVTTNYIPVQQVRYANITMASATQENTLQRDVENAAVDGAINIYRKTANGTVGGLEYLIFETNTLDNGFGGAYAHTTTSCRIHSTAAATDDVYVGSDIFFTSGNAEGQGGTITDYVASTKVITFAPAVSSAPAQGDNFQVAPRLQVLGDGQGANCRSNGTNASGLTDVVTIAAGSGYTNAIVNVLANTSWNLDDAAVVAAIEPKGGHGFDAVEELGGYNIMVNVRLENDESGEFTVANDFRKIGLISHPNAANTTDGSDLNVPATITLGDQALRVTVQSFSGAAYVADDLVTGAQSGATGRVIDWASGTSKLRISQVTKGANSTNGWDGTPGSFQANEALTIDGAGTTANSSVIEGPDLKPYTGDILYVENRSPISRARDQIEDVKLIINF